MCDACGEKEASVHLTQMVDEDVRKIHLCETCAAASGLDVNGPMSLTDMLFGLGGTKEQDGPVPDKTCPVCQMHFADFKKTTRLGCQNCYDAFAEEIMPLIEEMHRGKKHVGKMPARSVRKQGVFHCLPDLRSALRAAVDSENYEEAARIRDRIRMCAEKEQAK